jgi:hypothetical protein
MRHDGVLHVLCEMARRVGLVITTTRKHHPPLLRPPPGVNKHLCPDFVLLDYPKPGDVAVGDITVHHPNRPCTIARDGAAASAATALAAADRAEREKELKYTRFLRHLQTESGVRRPPEEHFAPLGMETYGAVSKKVKDLFNWLIRSWVSANQADASQAAYYRHEWKYRFSSAMQKWNGRMLADGKARVGQA